MNIIDIAILGLGAAVALSFVPWNKALEYVPELNLGDDEEDDVDARILPLKYVVDAMDIADAAGNEELANCLEDLLPMAAKSIRREQ